jgi:hypothetical protein
MRPLVPCSYSEARDSVCARVLSIYSLLTTHTPQIRLAETFLSIADSFRKPRGSLMPESLFSQW